MTGDPGYDSIQRSQRPTWYTAVPFTKKIEHARQTYMYDVDHKAKAEYHAWYVYVHVLVQLIADVLVFFIVTEVQAQVGIIRDFL